MQIKYLKDAPLGQAGDIKEVPDDQAKVLIILGFAKEYDEKGNDDKKPKRKPKTDKNAELELS